MIFFIKLIIFILLITNKVYAVPSSKAEIEGIIKEYLLKNPEILIESLEKYRSSQELKIEENKKLVINSYYKNKKYQNLPFTGNTNGKIVITEFVDYNCGYCKKTLLAINELVKKYEDLKVVFVDFPVLSETSYTAAKAAIAAFKQNIYFEYHSALLKNRKKIDDAYLIDLAKSFQIDIKRFKSDMDSEDTLKMLENNIGFAKELNIRGTPSFIINKKIYPGAYEIKKLEEILNKI